MTNSTARAVRIRPMMRVNRRRLLSLARAKKAEILPVGSIMRKNETRLVMKQGQIGLRYAWIMMQERSGTGG
jgi:hypothetical protein